MNLKGVLVQINNQDGSSIKGSILETDDIGFIVESFSGARLSIPWEAHKNGLCQFLNETDSKE